MSLFRSRTGRMLRGYRTAHDQQVMNQLMRGSDHVDGPAAVNPAATRLTPQVGNPGFVAQFDISILLKYFTVAAGFGGAYTNITAAALLAAQPTLATKFPAFVFGNSDFDGGFARLRAQFPVTIWAFDTPFIYGRDSNASPALLGNYYAAGSAAQLVVGDLVIPFTAVLGGVNYVAMVIVRCNQVAYGTLLGALSSDTFKLNMLRYIMSDTTAVGLAQYTNQITIFKQSLFGKNASDYVSPNSFKIPEQQQTGIIDIPLKKGIDKQVAYASYVNYDAVNVQWSLFVEVVDKLTYE